MRRFSSLLLVAALGCGLLGIVASAEARPPRGGGHYGGGHYGGHAYHSYGGGYYGHGGYYGGYHSYRPGIAFGIGPA